MGSSVKCGAVASGDVISTSFTSSAQREKVYATAGTAEDEAFSSHRDCSSLDIVDDDDGVDLPRDVRDPTLTSSTSVGGIDDHRRDSSSDPTSSSAVAATAAKTAQTLRLINAAAVNGEKSTIAKLIDGNPNVLLMRDCFGR